MGLGARGRGLAGPFPNLLSPGGRTQPLHKIRPGKPTPKGVGKPAGFLTLFRSGGVYAARIDFSIAQSHWAAEKSFPVFIDLCPQDAGR